MTALGDAGRMARRWAGTWLLVVLGWHVVRVAGGLACAMPAMGAATVSAAHGAHGAHAVHADHAAAGHHATPPPADDRGGSEGAHDAVACASGLACAAAVATVAPAHAAEASLYAAGARRLLADATAPPHAAPAPEPPPPKG